MAKSKICIAARSINGRAVGKVKPAAMPGLTGHTGSKSVPSVVGRTAMITINSAVSNTSSTTTTHTNAAGEFGSRLSCSQPRPAW
jgi:hypothetical protein